MKQFSLKTFLRKYPNNDACLQEIFDRRYPDGVFCVKCKKTTAYFKLKNRTAYSCTYCRSQIYPLAGTIFEKSTIDLRLWFYAIFVMINTRSGVSAKQLERELGVSYKTAHRMFKQIRTLMDESDGTKLEGTVEIDETYVGGDNANRRYKWSGAQKDKQVVMGMLARNGKAYLKHIPDASRITLITQIQENVSKEARIMTDSWSAYTYLPKLGYAHNTINHKKLYVKGDVHTQNIENFWSIMKRGIHGVYRHVSPAYLQQYANEYGFRYNNRHLGGGMFDLLLNQVASVKVLRAGQLS